MKKIVLGIVICCISFCAEAQVEKKTYYELPGVIVDGDTLAMIRLQKVYIFPKLKFSDNTAYQRYRKLVRDVKKVYPYAQIAKPTFNEIENIMDSLPNNKQRKKYIKAKEDELVDRYAKELLSMTVRQGEILIKLVNRELEHSSYDLIRELRGNVAATMWQGVAKIFGESLKSTYDPQGEDLLIERIVIQLEQGTLQ